MKSEQRQKEIRRENRRALWKFLLVLLASLIAGFAIGVVGVQAGDADAALAAVWDRLRPLAPYAAAVCAILFNGVTTVLFCRCRLRALAGLQDPQNEELLLAVEKQLDLPMTVNACGVIMLYFFFSCGVMQVETMQLWQMLTVLFSFAGGVAWVVVLQQKMVDLEKLLNPEKRGSVYDMRFAKKWEESCDEAEKLAIYRAAYRAYRAAAGACTALWCVFTVSGLFLHTGILPVLAVTVIWLTLCLSYCAACAKQDAAQKPSEI